MVRLQPAAEARKAFKDVTLPDLAGVVRDQDAARRRIRRDVLNALGKTPQLAFKVCRLGGRTLYWWDLDPYPPVDHMMEVRRDITHISFLPSFP